MGPFFIQNTRCHSCGGQGTSIKSNKVCTGCKGQKTHYTKKAFELKIPKGIPKNHELRMEEKGSYDERMKKNKDIVFRFRYDLKEPYEVDDECNVTYNLKISFEDVLGGFEKKVQIYNEEYTLRSEKYFNPNVPHIVPGMGLTSFKKTSKQGDLIIKFHVEFSESEKLKKYNDVLRKILKKPKIEDMTSDPSHSNTINIQ
jgi:DnaJ-class molecular chaperone